VKKLFFLILIFCISLVFSKTVDPEKKQLFQKAGYEMVLTPDKASEVLDYLEKNFKVDHEEQEKLDYLRTKSLFFQNNLTDALKRISDRDEKLPSDILILKKSILYYLGFQGGAVVHKRDNDILFSEQIVNLLSKLKQNPSKNVKQDLIAVSEKAKSGNLTIARENLMYLSDFIADNDNNLLYDSFLKAIVDLYKNDIQFQIIYAKYLLNNNKPELAEKLISDFPADSLEQTTNLNLKYAYYQLLIKLYAVKKSTEQYMAAVNKKDLLLKTLNETRFSAKNKWFNIVEENFKNEQQALVNSRKKILFSIIGIGLLAIILLAIRFFQIRLQVKEYQNFITKISLLKEKKAPQPQVISEKTENILLKKLEDFEKTEDFIRSDISLQNLAKNLETNTKYLSETINTHKQKNFNAYINELRIKYIVSKLKDKPVYRSYKIKYLAEESGFSTHSAFAAVFKSVMGMSPANYIQLLKQKEE